MPHIHVWFDETGSVLEEDNAQQFNNQIDIWEKLNMKYNMRVSAKGTSEVTQTAQFILRGLI